MKFWLTVQWPPREGDPGTDESGIFLPEGREKAGASIAPGDQVLVYESKTGRAKVLQLYDGSTRRLHCRVGMEGVVHYGQITEKLLILDDSKPENYVDGTTLWWRYYAPMEVLSRSGFASREDVCTILNYKRSFNFRGFGDFHSGLKEIKEDQYWKIVSIYHNSRPIKLPSYHIPRGGVSSIGGGGESDVHKKLKQLVAANPAGVLGEEGLKTLGVEYPFPTGDRADIVLSDKNNRIIGVEIEPDVFDNQPEGPLQAIKYRYMLEWATNRAKGDSRSMLIARSVSRKMKDRCKDYGIEVYELKLSELESIHDA